MSFTFDPGFTAEDHAREVRKAADPTAGGWGRDLITVADRWYKAAAERGISEEMRGAVYRELGLVFPGW
jgi:hypothetical protein